MSRPPAVRGACSRRTRLCTARSLVSTQSWSTKQAWLGNSGHSSVIQDKVRHTQKHKGTFWVALLSVYILIQIVPSLVSVYVSVYVITRQNCTPFCRFTPPQLQYTQQGDHHLFPYSEYLYRRLPLRCSERSLEKFLMWFRLLRNQVAILRSP